MGRDHTILAGVSLEQGSGGRDLPVRGKDSTGEERHVPGCRELKGKTLVCGVNGPVRQLRATK